MGKLTVIEIKNLVKPGRYTDGEGLHLHVRTPDRRAWVFRYMRQGKVRDMGLGPFPRITLAAARQKSRDARLIVENGGDPLTTRDAAAAAADAALARTFRRAAEDLLDARDSGWSNSKHRKQWSQTLATYAYPVLGDLPIQAVDTEAVLRVLQPIWRDKTETASRVRGRIEAVLDAAKARHWRTGENPARWKGHLAILLPRPAKVRKVMHMPSLPWRQIPVFVPELAAQQAGASSALHLLILTVARAGMVRMMTWAEVDLVEKLWTIPAAKMKGGVEHRVPLSAAALMLLAAAAEDRRLRTEAKLGRPGKGADLVFPGGTGKPLSDMTMTALLRRMNNVGKDQPAPWLDGQTGEPIVPHGFRSTFRVWASEQTTYPREIIEAAMAHALEDKVEAAYQRSDLMEKRRALMEDWGGFCAASITPRQGLY